MGLLLTPMSGNADQLEALSPEASRAQFALSPGVHIELVAAEPEVFDPVAMCFDKQGNLYVVENRGYPSGSPDGPAGTVAMLQDKDGDGRYKTRNVFAKGFDFPNGIMPWKDGVLVTAAPHVYFLKDTDGDHVADVHEIFLEGFTRGGSTQLYVSHPTLGIDNGLHFTNGLSGGIVGVPGHPEIPELDMGRNDLRYDPLSHALEVRAGRAQFGLSFDDFGHKFTCSNRNHLVHSVLEPADLARNPYLNRSTVVQDIPIHGAASPVFAVSNATTTAYAHEGTFTAACGLVIYRGTALPKKYYGNSFVCEPTGNLVHRDIIAVKGGSFEAFRDPDETKTEFLATTDEWSRPVFLTNGPDGSLYLCDMYRQTIEHPTYLPDEVAATTDFDAGKANGRIYRITAASEYRPATLKASTPKTLVEALGHPNGWHRDTAQRLLLENMEPDVIPLLEKSLHLATSPQAHALSLHLLNAADALTPVHLLGALRDDSAVIREQGLRLARELGESSPELRAAIIQRANDPDENVRFACALVLGDTASPRSDTLLALSSILKKDIDDPWVQVVVLSALGNAASAFSEQLLQEEPTGENGWLDFMEGLSRIIALSESPESIARYTTRILDDGPNKESSWRLAALKGVLDGVQRNTKFPKGPTPIRTLTKVIPDYHTNQPTQIDSWIAKCKQLLNRAVVSQEVKLLAIHVLGHTDLDTSGETLTRLLSPNTTQRLQVAAITALNGFRNDRVAQEYLQRNVWLGFSGETRRVALNGILTAANGLELLLTALENESIGAWSIDAAGRARLCRTGTPDQRKRAVELFAALEESDPAKRYEEYRDALTLTPKPENGRRVFQELCMGCHRFENLGHDVGPDLSGIRSQSLESILVHIVNPNRLMLSGYESYYVETHDGKVYTGLIASETSTSVTLKQGLGIQTTILRKDILVLETNSLSMMPEELEAGMTRQELRNLLGFLKAE
ncbi:MAG: PVC-type heme-binding CxxCH protein [Candidatus Hydrogenedentota bacterium]